MGQIAFMGSETTYAERKRIRDREIATTARIILRDQKDLTRTEATRLATSLYEQGQPYISINSTIETDAEITSTPTELEMYTTTGSQADGDHFIEQTPQHNPVKNVQGLVLTDEQRTVAKAVILDVMGRVWIVKTACAEAGISRNTYDYWVSVGYLTTDELADAYKRYQDAIREELTKLGFVGEGQPLVHNGRIVHNKAGQRELIYKKNVNILLRMAAKHLPEFADQPKQVEITHHSDSIIPTAYALVIDTRLLTKEQFTILKSIAADLDQRRGIIDSTPL